MPIKVELEPEDEHFIEQKMKSGHYNNPAAVVHQLIGAVRQVHQALDQRLIAALTSGPATPLDAGWKQRVREDAR